MRRGTLLIIAKLPSAARLIYILKLILPIGFKHFSILLYYSMCLITELDGTIKLAICDDLQPQFKNTGFLMIGCN